MFKIATKIMILLMLLFTSCTTVSCNLPISGLHGDSTRHILPRQSFVKIEKIVKIKVCDPADPDECFNQKLVSSGSGFIVKIDGDGAYVMTAGHVCDDSELATFSRPNIHIIEKSFNVLDIDNARFIGKIINLSMCEDLCVAYVPNLRKPPVRVAQVQPAPGDTAYNLAAPLGVFDKNMIPILHGHFSGVSEGMAVYTIPAVGGSSGSPVFNHRGEVIGMIHSVLIRFSSISLSPTHQEIVDFIEANANRKALLKKMIED